MSATIQFRRGSTATTPTLASGEPRWNYETKVLWIGDSSGNQPINATTNSVIRDGSNQITLSGDTASPGNNKVYGTNGSGVRGWYDAASGGGVSDGDKGDVVVSSSGTVWTIDAGVVTFAKMQDISTGKLLGRSTSGTGDVEEITVGSGLSLSDGTLSATGSGVSFATLAKLGL